MVMSVCYRNGLSSVHLAALHQSRPSGIPAKIAEGRSSSYVNLPRFLYAEGAFEWFSLLSTVCC